MAVRRWAFPRVQAEGAFEIEVLKAIKWENTSRGWEWGGRRKEEEEKAEIFPQFFQIKAGNFITKGSVFYTGNYKVNTSSTPLLEALIYLFRDFLLVF